MLMHENAVSKQRKSKAIKTGMDLHTKKENIQPFSAVKKSTHSYGNEHLLLSNSLHLGTKRRHMRDIMHRPMERLLSGLSISMLYNSFNFIRWPSNNHWRKRRRRWRWRWRGKKIIKSQTCTMMSISPLVHVKTSKHISWLATLPSKK